MLEREETQQRAGGVLGNVWDQRESCAEHGALIYCQFRKTRLKIITRFFGA